MQAAILTHQRCRKCKNLIMADSALLLFLLIFTMDLLDCCNTYDNSGVAGCVPQNTAVNRQENLLSKCQMVFKGSVLYLFILLIDIICFRVAIASGDEEMFVRCLWMPEVNNSDRTVDTISFARAKEIL